MTKEKIIIDVDTGTDDAIALACALQNRDILDICAVTATAGNVSLNHTAENTINLLDQLGHADIAVCLGAEKPLKKEPIFASSHGQTGLGDVKLKKTTRLFSPQHAVETIYEYARKYQGDLVLLATGPQTNLASALLKYPDINKYIKHIYIMGGALCGGNVSAAFGSEFNAYVDPEALQIVLKSGIPITMTGLDVTTRLSWSKEVTRQLEQIDSEAARVVSAIMAFTKRNSLAEGSEEANMHDVAAFCSMVNPDIFTFKDYYMDVETEGTITRGITIVDSHNNLKRPANVRYAVDINLDKFWKWFIHTIERSGVK